MINVLGGKWTTYRKMAEDAVDAFYHFKTEEMKLSSTLDYTLIGAPEDGEFDEIVHSSMLYDAPKDIVEHISNYGTEVKKLVQFFENEGIKRLHPDYPCTTAEVHFAIDNMYAHTIDDILSRRTRLEVFNVAAAVEAAPLVAGILEKKLGWDQQRKQRELKEYLEKLNNKDKFVVH